MVGMEFRTPQLLPPFIIFSGGFCNTLTKKAQICLDDNNSDIMMKNIVTVLYEKHYHDAVLLEKK